MYGHCAKIKISDQKYFIIIVSVFPLFYHFSFSLASIFSFFFKVLLSPKENGMSNRSIRETEYSPFPTDWQAVVFCSYGYLPTERIAAVLQCEVETVEREAGRLGLDNVIYRPETGDRGFITVIRDYWRLLPNGQLAELLRFDEETLQFHLENDDFLSVKLGPKPDVGPVYYAPLTPEQERATEALASYIRNRLPLNAAAPFDFLFGRDGKGKGGLASGRRILHGYLSPCGDPFSQDSRKFLPDALLAEYQRQGINGLWLHGLLFALSPYPFDESASEGFRERRDHLKKLVARCRAYGIDLFIYLNEPRALSPEAVGRNGRLIGHRESDGRACLCLRIPEVRQYLYEAIRDLLTAVPDLGGFITITMSENPTHCRYRTATNCPRCAGILPEESAADVNNLIQAAIRDVGSRAELIANLWGWSSFMGWTEEQSLHGIALLDPAVSVMCVSEYDLPITKGGVPGRVIDYSLSNPGPSPLSEAMLKKAARLGHRCYAKIQINNSWECSAVPYLPVFDLIYEHLENLYRIGIRDYMLTWTLGGYPSPMTEMVSAFMAKGEAFSLAAWYEERFGYEADIVREAADLFCRGFREYPFSLAQLYFSPHTRGPGNSWRQNVTEDASTMVGFAFDDYEKWIDPYPYEIYLSQYQKLLSSWNRGLAILQKAKKSRILSEMADYAEAAAIHWEADLLHTQYAYAKRHGDPIPEKLVGRMIAITERLMALCAERPEIGFEASNHYYYHDRTLLKNILQLKRLSNSPGIL